jgi:hypothetical protein
LPPQHCQPSHVPDDYIRQRFVVETGARILVGDRETETDGGTHHLSLDPGGGFRFESIQQGEEAEGAIGREREDFQAHRRTVNSLASLCGTEPTWVVRKWKSVMNISLV